MEIPDRARWHLHDRRIAYLQEVGFPFSIIGRCADKTGLAHTDIDFEQTVRAAVTHLSELGHTDIAFLNYAREVFEAGYGPAVRVGCTTRFGQKTSPARCSR